MRLLEVFRIQGQAGEGARNQKFTRRPGRPAALIKSICLFSLWFFCLPGCDTGPKGECVLFDFESPSELDQLEWSCRILYSISQEHATHGSRSLEMQLYPAQYPGLTPILKKKNWNGYRALSFDIYNPQERELSIAVRIDDREYPEYKDRFNKTFILRPGGNNVSIPFSTLITSGTHRQLKLGSIHKFIIFMTEPKERMVLYTDYIRLIM
jgi:hypothetical protein